MRQEWITLEKLTKRRFEEEELVLGEYTGPSAADLACYKFDLAQSVTTIQHNTDKIKSTSAGKSVASLSINESVFTLHNEDNNSDEDANKDAGGLAAASDPLTSLCNEEMQFDLSFMTSQTQARGNDALVNSSGQSNSKDSRESPLDESTKSQLNMAKELEFQFKDATSDAGLAAAAIGLDLLSAAHEDIQDKECFCGCTCWDR
jgi:hypothetical protein